MSHHLRNRIATGLAAVIAATGLVGGAVAGADTASEVPADSAAPSAATGNSGDYYLLPFQYVEYENQGSLFPVGNPIPYDPATTKILNTKPTESTMKSTVPTWALAAMGFGLILVLLICAAFTQRAVRSWKK